MAKKSNTKRKIVALVSQLTGHRTYVTRKNTQNTPDKLELMKYDPKARRHVKYVETKKNLGRNEVKPRKG
ncbi:MAG TPA: 50S ribosomal protein L33 [Candidatus Saccharibacteria bacterium]|jgi:large subunit ribosomal protein L33|nr:50S ribosomal protein L33 [Candidatus Saccharibacteria bacterium]HMR38713.1 50S ribosomal protein L33 [Candidatus Saccharibacteria bacterium]